MQPEKGITTTEAKLIAFAHCCNELFPIMNMIYDICSAFGSQQECDYA